MAEKLLSKKLGEVEVNGLVTAIDPHIVIGAGVIRKASSGTLKLSAPPQMPPWPCIWPGALTLARSL